MIKILPRKIRYIAVLSMLTGFITSASFYFFGYLFQIFLYLVGFIENIQVAKIFSFLTTNENIFLIIFSFAILLQGFCQFLQIYITRIFNEMLIFESRSNFFDLLFKKKSSWKLDMSTTSNILSEVIPKSASYIGSKVKLISLIIQLIFITIFCLIESYSKFFQITAGLLIVVPFVIYYKRKFKNISSEILNLSSEFNKNLIRSVINFPFIKISSIEEKEKFFLIKSARKYYDKFIKSMYYLSINASFPQSIGSIVIILVFFYISKESNSNYMVLFYLIYRFVGTMSQILASYQNLNVYQSHYNLMKKITKESFVEEQINSNEKIKFSKIKDYKTLLEINNLSFSFSSGDKNNEVFSNISLQLSKNENLLIKGPSGSGKSSLLLCLIGILGGEKNYSSIKWKDRNFNNLDVEDLRKSVSYVGAEPFIVSGTIRENILFGLNKSQMHTIEEKDIIKACAIAEANDFINKKDQKLEAKLNEYGDGLSMGQKQRICLARALVRNPLVLILDEITANLDKETEVAIVNSLEALKGKINIIVTTHSDAFDKICDKSIILQKN